MLTQEEIRQNQEQLLQIYQALNDEGKELINAYAFQVYMSGEFDEKVIPFSEIKRGYNQ